nr:hypothetical protein [Mailhella massiliensis]
MKNEEYDAGENNGKQYGNDFMWVPPVENGKKAQQCGGNKETDAGKKKKETDNEHYLKNDLPIIFQGKGKRCSFFQKGFDKKKRRTDGQAGGYQQRKLPIPIRIVNGDRNNGHADDEEEKINKDILFPYAHGSPQFALI